MLKQLTKKEKLQKKLNKETNSYKKDQLENRIRLLEKNCLWNSSEKGTYRKPKEVE